MSDWLYWTLFALAFVLAFGAVPVAAWWEREQDRRDKEAWERWTGGLR